MTNPVFGHRYTAIPDSGVVELHCGTCPDSVRWEAGYHPSLDVLIGQARAHDAAEHDNDSGTAPGQAVYERHHALLRLRFPGIAPIAWDELGKEAQDEWEDIAQAGVAAYISLNGSDPVDPAAVIADAIAPELRDLRVALGTLTDRAEAGGVITGDEADEYRRVGGPGRRPAG